VKAGSSIGVGLPRASGKPIDDYFINDVSSIMCC